MTPREPDDFARHNLCRLLTRLTSGYKQFNMLGLPHNSGITNVVPNSSPSPSTAAVGGGSSAAETASQSGRPERAAEVTARLPCSTVPIGPTCTFVRRQP
jgi:hypothetical protein